MLVDSTREKAGDSAVQTEQDLVARLMGWIGNLLSILALPFTYCRLPFSSSRSQFWLVLFRCSFAGASRIPEISHSNPTGMGIVARFPTTVTTLPVFGYPEWNINRTNPLILLSPFNPNKIEQLALRSPMWRCRPTQTYTPMCASVSSAFAISIARVHDAFAYILVPRVHTGSSQDTLKWHGPFVSRYRQRAVLGVHSSLQRSWNCWSNTENTWSLIFLFSYFLVPLACDAPYNLRVCDKKSREQLELFSLKTKKKEKASSKVNNKNPQHSIVTIQQHSNSEWYFIPGLH